jgi:hypothetical protein
LTLLLLLLLLVLVLLMALTSPSIASQMMSSDATKILESHLDILLQSTFWLQESVTLTNVAFLIWLLFHLVLGHRDALPVSLGEKLYNLYMRILVSPVMQQAMETQKDRTTLMQLSDMGDLYVELSPEAASPFEVEEMVKEVTIIVETLKSTI